MGKFMDKSDGYIIVIKKKRIIICNENWLAHTDQLFHSKSIQDI